MLWEEDTLPRRHWWVFQLWHLDAWQAVSVMSSLSRKMLQNGNRVRREVSAEREGVSAQKLCGHQVRIWTVFQGNCDRRNGEESGRRQKPILLIPIIFLASLPWRKKTTNLGGTKLPMCLEYLRAVQPPKECLYCTILYSLIYVRCYEVFSTDTKSVAWNVSTQVR